jgi:putative NADH-flavin reductase
VGENEILVGENGEASISHEDLVMAYINEIEDPQAVGKRITIGY